MAEYFRRLASYASQNRLAIVDPPSSNTSPPRQHSYAELLLRASVYREYLIAMAERTQKTLQGARVGLMVRPGAEFVAAILGIWSVEAIVGQSSLARLCIAHEGTN